MVMLAPQQPHLMKPVKRVGESVFDCGAVRSPPYGERKNLTAPSHHLMGFHKTGNCDNEAMYL